jgi:DNA-binding MarR family transcriptional regulator
MSNQLSFSVSIPMSILMDKKLSSTDKLVYAMICGLSKKNGDCWASNAYIATQLDLKKDTVSRVISKLVEIGYVKRKEFRNENKEVVKRLLSSIHALSNVLPDFNTIPLLEENDNPIGEISNTSPKEILVDIEDYNNKDNNNIYKAKKEKKEKKVFVPPTEEEVKAFFQENKYTEEIAIRAFHHYAGNDWCDTYGNKVLNWKSKMRNNWFKDQYKIQEGKIKVRDMWGGTHLKTREEINKAEPGFFKEI